MINKMMIWNEAQKLAKRDPKLARAEHFAEAKRIYAELLANASKEVPEIKIEEAMKNFWDTHKIAKEFSPFYNSVGPRGERARAILLNRKQKALLILRKYSGQELELHVGKYLQFMVNIAGGTEVLNNQ